MLRLPRKEQLPEGPRRTFVEELHMHYREADRPTLRAISAWITKMNEDEKTELGATASIETIRRVLIGSTIPRAWPTVKVIFLALCGIAERNPEQERWDTGYNNDSESFEEVLKRYWNDALDDEERLPTLPPRPQPQVSPPPSFGDDPWAIAPSKSSAFDEEPPF